MDQVIIERIDEKLRELPQDQLSTVLDFVSFLTARRQQAMASETLLMAETALRKDWDSPEEDAAWANL